MRTICVYISTAYFAICRVAQALHALSKQNKTNNVVAGKVFNS